MFVLQLVRADSCVPIIVTTRDTLLRSSSCCPSRCRWKRQLHVYFGLNGKTWDPPTASKNVPYTSFPVGSTHQLCNCGLCHVSRKPVRLKREHWDVCCKKCQFPIVVRIHPRTSPSTDYVSWVRFQRHDPCSTIVARINQPVHECHMLVIACSPHPIFRLLKIITRSNAFCNSCIQLSSPSNTRSPPCLHPRLSSSRRWYKLGDDSPISYP